MNRRDETELTNHYSRWQRRRAAEAESAPPPQPQPNVMTRADFTNASDARFAKPVVDETARQAIEEQTLCAAPSLEELPPPANFEEESQ
jgi:hypothetical protein